jgi:hypothetical protein
MAANKRGGIEKQFVFNTVNIEDIKSKQMEGFAIPRYMNPWFKNQIGVRRSNCVFGWTSHELTEFAKCSASVTYFANTYCKVKGEEGNVIQMTLRDYQYDVINSYDKNRFTINMSSRQTGKCAHLITNIKCKINGVIKTLPAFKVLFKYKKNKTIFDYIKYPLYKLAYNIKNKKRVFNIIEKIEKVQYRNVKLNENDILQKIKNITFTDNDEFYIDSPQGFVKVLEINETQPYTIYNIKLANKEIYCADNHILYYDTGQQVCAVDLKCGDKILTKDGPESVVSIDILNSSNGMIDFTVDSDQKTYYTNDIVSHNTITSVITILHYAIFNSGKGIMVVANKNDTVIEIVDKIKNMYKLLPFFLKPGVVNWNTKSIVFDNGCRIKSQARSKEPAIGFVIDFLYMDEFAHIPPNIINNYYRAAIPTVSSMSNSKIVITSTPNGANLFKELVLGAQLPEGHPEKNMYNFVKVLWWQVPNGKFDDGTRGTRLDPKLFTKHDELLKYNLTIDDIKAKFDFDGYKTAIQYEKTSTGDKQYLRIEHRAGEMDVDVLRKMKIGPNNDIPLIRLFDITNWHENEIKLIGGEENFNQEYNCLFVAGSKRVLSANKAKELESRSVEYVYRKNEYLDILRFGYDQLRWHPDYVERERNKYYWFAAMDLSEGLGFDDTVINLFRLKLRSHEWLKENKIRNMYEGFYLEQTGVYNSNIISPDIELPQLVYLLFFKYLNPERLKVSIEYNGPGSTMLAAMPGVFDGNNDYGNYIFVRYKHRQDVLKKKIGLKMTSNKKNLVKKYITRIENDDMYVNESETLAQMDSFIKVETRTSFTYKADSGKDDIVMTNVIGSTFLDTQDYKNMCISYYNELSSYDKKILDSAIENIEFGYSGGTNKTDNGRFRQIKKNKRRNRRG